MHILLIEDETDLRVLAASGLERRGFAVDAVPTLAAAHDCLAVSRFDAAIVDRRLPDGEGLSLLPLLARHGVPALVATAFGDVEDRIAGLDAGADDYVVKPYDLDELAARLRALLRRPGQRQPPVLAQGPMRLDTGAQQAWLNDVPLDLGRREFALLRLLLEAMPGVVIRDIVQDRLYTLDEAVSPNALEAIVSRLRKRLAPGGFFIENWRGIGWRLVIGEEP
ncbi:MAG: response regulator [Polymorphobacter sp.]|uniref:response regulator n=1 Tax=Polymorphobacter sp. TaxID=1909290 RepID=UPI003A895110